MPTLLLIHVLVPVEDAAPPGEVLLGVGKSGGTVSVDVDVGGRVGVEGTDAGTVVNDDETTVTVAVPEGDSVGADIGADVGVDVAIGEDGVKEGVPVGDEDGKDVIADVLEAENVGGGVPVAVIYCQYGTLAFQHDEYTIHSTTHQRETCSIA